MRITGEILAIVTQDNAWFCRNCKKSHSILYFVKKNLTYCTSCVPEDVKKRAIKVNQNGIRL